MLEEKVKPVSVPTGVPLTGAEIARQSITRAFQSGSAGASAMVLEVFGLMWLRTTVNYQYRNGTNTKTALRSLYADGGIRRFYRGISAALIQAPLSRFSDTACNTGVLTYLNTHPEFSDMSTATKTLFASSSAALLRASYMPIDTVKTTLQVKGKDGRNILIGYIKNNPSRFYYGAVGAMVAKWSAHFPFFTVYNILHERVPVPETLEKKLLRNGCIGFVASICSDTIANTFRVLKTFRQTYHEKISYFQAARLVTKSDGKTGLVTRGLSTRIISNGIQGIVFLMLWTVIDQTFFGGVSMKLKLEKQESKLRKFKEPEFIEKEEEPLDEL